MIFNSKYQKLRLSNHFRMLKYRVWGLKRNYDLSKNFKNSNQVFWKLINNSRISELILKNDIKISAPTNNTLMHLVEEIFFNNVYLPDGYKIKPDDVVVDVGANIGIFSIFSAMYTQKKIYSIEPFNENIKYLKKNILINSFKNLIQIEPYALSDIDSEKKLYISKTSGGHLLFNKNINGKLEKFVKVPTKNLKYLINKYNLKRINFLKLDCEGSEGHIIKSLTSQEFEMIDKIVMEFHNNVSILNHNDIAELLKIHNYDVDVDWNGKSMFGYLYAKKKS
ncbi:MAG: hypothetical protein CMG62_07105 [Candidatus Marinimicrobia bacterium]|nr:hypothetical protein [Candidatus Neomarinimicrobiota bacterium]